ncbi:MAG: HD-GYP domain-containing protein [Acidimicrobiales bacterium]
MSDVPTRGATEPERSWSRAPAAARVLRATTRVLPLLTAWLAVRGTAHWYLRPEGSLGLVAWLVQAIAVSVVVSTTVDHVARRLLPLAALLNLSLAFPNEAPSRFGIALRAGSAKRLQQRLDQVASEGLGDNPDEAARRALDLVASLSAHDRLTRGHTERVRAYAELIARELGLDDSERLHLAWGVLLHDIGKLTVPAEILNKDADLTAEEWAVLRNHPAAGQAILAPLSGWLDDWIRAAGEHHERWDGEGYPAGLAGTRISLAGRITAVADAYDVITSARSYKKPMSAAAARQELVRCAGSQFDPAVVRAFLSASVRRRWHGGPLAWVAELPSLGRLTTTLSNSAGAATATAAAIVAGVTGIASLAPEPPDQLALVAPAPTLAPAPLPAAPPVDTAATSTPAAANSSDQPASTPTAPAGAVAPSETTAEAVSPTTATATPTTVPPVTAPPSSAAAATPTTAAPATTHPTVTPSSTATTAPRSTPPSWGWGWGWRSGNGGHPNGGSASGSGSNSGSNGG